MKEMKKRYRVKKVKQRSHLKEARQRYEKEVKQSEGVDRTNPIESSDPNNNMTSTARG